MRIFMCNETESGLRSSGPANGTEGTLLRSQQETAEPPLLLLETKFYPPKIAAGPGTASADCTNVPSVAGPARS